MWMGSVIGGLWRTVDGGCKMGVCMALEIIGEAVAHHRTVECHREHYGGNWLWNKSSVLFM